MNPRRLLALIGAPLMLGAAVAPVAAQVTERPVAFDSAGRVMIVTAPLAARLGLVPPSWPVTGDFVEARLYDLGNDRFVVAVQRSGGVMERYEISAESRAALRRATTTGMAAAGGLTTRERQDLESESAGGAFVRNQTLLGLIVYGPAAAALVDGGAGAGALYFATAGATFFSSLAISRSQSVSRAQNRLATDGGWRGSLIALGAKYALTGSDDEGSANAATMLAGGLLGSTLGFRAGRPLTDGEANVATFGSTFTTLTTLGVIGSLGGFGEEDAYASDGTARDDEGDDRAEIAALVAAAIAGYPLGLRFARGARYSITAGDVGATATSGVIGALAAATLLGDGTSDEAGAAILTAGYLAGTFLGLRSFATPYDLTDGEGRLIGLGALAGGLAAIAIPTLASVDDGRTYLALGSIGAALGMTLTRKILSPETAEPRTADPGADPAVRVSPVRASSRSGPAFSFHPENASLLLARGRGRTVVPLARVTF